jgi:xylose isomerase
MRTYLILKERACRWNHDTEIQAMVKANGNGRVPPAAYSAAHRDALLNREFDRTALAAKGLGYERLDQLTMEVLLGVR